MQRQYRNLWDDNPPRRAEGQRSRGQDVDRSNRNNDIEKSGSAGGTHAADILSTNAVDLLNQALKMVKSPATSQSALPQYEPIVNRDPGVSWTCTKCGTKNYDGRKCCVVCTSPWEVPVTTATHSKAGQEDEDKEVRKLHVSNLRANMTTSDLFRYFSKWGQMDQVFVATTERGESKQFGFVQYMDAQDAEKCLMAGPHIIDQKNIQVKYAATRDKNAEGRQLSVTGLTPQINNDQLMRYFSHSGAVEDGLVETDPTGRKTGKGFMKFGSAKEANLSASSQPHIIDGKLVSTIYSSRLMKKAEAVPRERSPSPEIAIPGLNLACKSSNADPKPAKQTQYLCRVSGCLFQGERNLFEKHWNECHEPKVNYLVCSFCSMGCVDKDDFVEHLNFFHGVEKQEMAKYLMEVEYEERDNTQYIMPGNVTRYTCIKTVEDEPISCTLSKPKTAEFRRCNEYGCSFTGTTDEFLKHFSSKHVSELVYLRCPMCPKSFQKRASLEFHLEHAHQNADAEEEDEISYPSDEECDYATAVKLFLTNQENKASRTGGVPEQMLIGSATGPQSSLKSSNSENFRKRSNTPPGTNIPTVSGMGARNSQPPLSLASQQFSESAFAQCTGFQSVQGMAPLQKLPPMGHLAQVFPIGPTPLLPQLQHQPSQVVPRPDTMPQTQTLHQQQALTTHQGMAGTSKSLDVVDWYQKLTDSEVTKPSEEKTKKTEELNNRKESFDLEKEASKGLIKLLGSETVVAERHEWPKEMTLPTMKKIREMRTFEKTTPMFQVPSIVIPPFKRTNLESIQSFLLWSEAMLSRLETVNLLSRRKLMSQIIDIKPSSDIEDVSADELVSDDDSSSAALREKKNEAKRLVDKMASEMSKSRVNKVSFDLKKKCEDMADEILRSHLKKSGQPWKAFSQDSRSKNSKGKVIFSKEEKDIHGKLTGMAIGKAKQLALRRKCDAAMVGRAMSWARQRMIYTRDHGLDETKPDKKDEVRKVKGEMLPTNLGDNSKKLPLEVVVDEEKTKDEEYSLAVIDEIGVHVVEEGYTMGKFGPEKKGSQGPGTEGGRGTSQMRRPEQHQSKKSSNRKHGNIDDAEFMETEPRNSAGLSMRNGKIDIAQRDSHVSVWGDKRRLKSQGRKFRNLNTGFGIKKNKLRQDFRKNRNYFGQTVRRNTLRNNRSKMEINDHHRMLSDETSRPDFQAVNFVQIDNFEQNTRVIDNMVSGFDNSRARRPDNYRSNRHTECLDRESDRQQAEYEDERFPEEEFIEFRDNNQSGRRFHEDGHREWELHSGNPEQDVEDEEFPEEEFIEFRQDYRRRHDCDPNFRQGQNMSFKTQLALQRPMVDRLMRVPDERIVEVVPEDVQEDIPEDQFDSSDRVVEFVRYDDEILQDNMEEYNLLQTQTLRRDQMNFRNMNRQGNTHEFVHQSRKNFGNRDRRGLKKQQPGCRDFRQKNFNSQEHISRTNDTEFGRDFRHQNRKGFQHQNRMDSFGHDQRARQSFDRLERKTFSHGMNMSPEKVTPLSWAEDIEQNSGERVLRKHQDIGVPKSWSESIEEMVSREREKSNRATSQNKGLMNSNRGGNQDLCRGRRGSRERMDKDFEDVDMDDFVVMDVA